MVFIKEGMTLPQISTMYENERQSRVGYAVVKEILSPFGLAATAARRHYRDSGGKGDHPDVEWFNRHAEYPVKFGAGKLERKSRFVDEIRKFKSSKSGEFEKSLAFLGYMDLLDTYPDYQVAYCVKFNEFKEVFAFTEASNYLGKDGWDLRRQHGDTCYSWRPLSSILVSRDEWNPRAMLGISDE
jgi:hypothetical protein